MSDVCKTKTVTVEVQANGIVRDTGGVIIARLGNSCDFVNFTEAPNDKLTTLRAQLREHADEHADIVLRRDEWFGKAEYYKAETVRLRAQLRQAEKEAARQLACRNLCQKDRNDYEMILRDLGDGKLTTLLDRLKQAEGDLAELQYNQDPELAINQPCGCVVCTCEDEDHCSGCGAKRCRGDNACVFTSDRTPTYASYAEAKARQPQPGAPSPT